MDNIGNLLKGGVNAMAYIKICPGCEKESFSATKLSKWTCPYCGKDLSYIKTKREDDI